MTMTKFEIDEYWEHACREVRHYWEEGRCDDDYYYEAINHFREMQRQNREPNGE